MIEEGTDWGELNILKSRAAYLQSTVGESITGQLVKSANQYLDISEGLENTKYDI